MHVYIVWVCLDNCNYRPTTELVIYEAHSPHLSFGLLEFALGHVKMCGWI